MEEFDYIVIGAGSAGCIVAARLAEQSDCTVCVIEAGPKDWHPYIHIPVGWMKLMSNRTLNWMYEAEPSEWTGGRRIAVPRGKVVGGSSSINGNVFNRGAPADFDHWAQRGNPGWGYEDMLPLFKRLESWTGPSVDDLRGRDGLLKVTPSPWTHPLCEAFLDAAAGLGIPRNPDYNGRQQFGAAYTQRTISSGMRQSSAKAFLKPALKNANIALRTNAQVTRIDLVEKRANGITYRQGGQLKSIRARREIILSGGVINSPQLLQVSGVGDPEHLAEIGVEVQHNLPGVGANLRDHFTPRFTARVKGTSTFNEKSRGLAFLKETAKWMTGQPSILSLPATACYAFAKSDPVLDDSDLQITFMPASYKEGVQSQLDDQPGMTLAAWQQRPDSTGYVRARSSDPFAQPIIQPNYLSAASDQRVLLSGLKLVRQLMRSEAMKPYFDGEIYPGELIQSDGELLNTARERGTTTFHMMGTCRMGPAHDATAVVDHQLKVRGVDGLRIADASIMPTMPAANTNAACLLIGEKAGALLTANQD
ncbi:MAG: GMC family oxidoreductase N-terminal domain-containing protein [Rhizobiaceae bacterium]